MQIVIDIPEDVYTRLFDNGIQDNEIATDDICEMARSLRQGTPLPKGHGRLIDADALDMEHEIEMADDWKTAHEIANCVKYAPTIIEGTEDKE